MSGCIPTKTKFVLITFVGICFPLFVFYLRYEEFQPEWQRLNSVRADGLRNDPVLALAVNRSSTADDANENVTMKTILFWNSFFSQRDYGLGGFGRAPFVRGGCRVDACRTTDDPRALPDADAVVVHAAYGLPPGSRLPLRASPEQVFVFYEFEPPALLRFELANLNDLFNLTFTYLRHHDTDIYSPYGRVRRRRRRSAGERYRPPSLAAVTNKTKKVVWVVSDCKPVSKRWEYAAELAKHIDVDVLGKCGRDDCPPGRGCSERIEREYKFCLAFENSVCDDYVTEKTFRVLFRHHVIPIVLGGADYWRHVPRHSVIDVRDFRSPAHLARRLHEIDRNRSKFVEYFAWKRHYYVDTAPRIAGFCRLCEILHTKDYPYKTEFRVDRYWSEETAHCVRGDEEERLIHLNG